MSNLRNRRVSQAAVTVVESLERRALMCALHESLSKPVEIRPDLEGQPIATEGGPVADIQWINRANTTAGGAGDTDGFGAVFGANANIARGVVDAVINSYEQMILSFNYSDGSADFDLTVSMGGGQGRGGAGGTSTLLGGKPKSGALTLQTGDNGAGAGWYLDQTPNDYSEFSDTIINAFAADAPIGSNLAAQGDLYTVAAAEVAHCLGLLPGIALWDARNTDTNINDNNEGNNIADFFVFQGPSIQHLMTEFNSGNPTSFGGAVHTAGPGAVNFNNITWEGAQDAGNAIYETGRRYLVPDTLGLMFRDAYGYTTLDAGIRPTFYAMLNSTTDVLTIRGEDFGVADTITIDRTGSFYSVSVDPSADVPGTGALPGAGNLPAFTQLFPAADVSQIVIEGFGGNDTFNINGIFSGDSVTVRGGEGADTINLSPADDTMNLLSGNLTIEGGTGIDSIVMHDTSNTFNDTYTVTSTTLFRTIVPTINYSSSENLRIDGGSGNNTININSLLSTSALTVNANNGTDTYNIGNGNLANVAGTFAINGGSGVDVVTLNDNLSTASETTIINSNRFEHPNFGAMSYATMETFTVNAASGNDRFTIDSTAAGTTWIINANNGNDDATLAFGFGNLEDIDGQVTFNGGAGTDSMTMWDDLSTQSDGTTIGASAVVHSGMATFFYNTLEALILNCASGNNPIDIVATALGCTTTINAGNGNDSFNVTIASGDLDNAPGAIVFNGGAGTDTGTIWDDFEGANVNYAMSATNLSRTGFGGFTYGMLEGLTLQASAGNNTFTVNSTSVPTTINGNAGNDTINIAQLGGNLDAIDGAVSLSGGNGTDTVHLFDGTSTDANSYLINDNSVSNLNFAGLNYAFMEGVVVNCADGANTIDIATTAAGVPVTVNGDGGADTLRLAFSSGDIGGVDGRVTFDGGAAADLVTVYDDLNATNDVWDVGLATVRQAGFAGLDYTNTVETVSIEASSGINTFNIMSASASTAVRIDGNNGNDVMSVGQGDLDNDILSNVTLIGGGGSDSVLFNDQTDGLGADIYTMQNDTLRKITGGTSSWQTVESVEVFGSNNADAYEIISMATAIPVTINGGNGNDQFILGAAVTGVLSSMPGALTIFGDAGTSDSITVNDTGSTLPDQYLLTSTLLEYAGLGSMTYFTVESLRLNASTGNNIITVGTTANLTPVSIFANNGTDTITVQDTAANAPVTILPSIGNDTVNVNPNGGTPATVRFGGTQRIGALTISNGGRAETLAANMVITASSVDVGAAGVLNLADNTLIVDYTGASPVSTIGSLLTTGRNNGAWTGNGINSSAAASQSNRALGYAEATDIFGTFPASFAGESVDNTSVLVRYTLLGDATLDRTVNISDFALLAANFNVSGTRWSSGNFNFDAQTDISDFATLAANFNTSIPADLPRALFGEELIAEI